MKKMLRAVAMPAIPATIDKTAIDRVLAVISTLRAEAFDEIHSLEQYTIEQEISDIQTALGTMEDSIEAVQASISTIEGEITSLDARVDDVEETIDQMDVSDIAAFLSYFLLKCSDENQDILTDENGDVCIYQRL